MTQQQPVPANTQQQQYNAPQFFNNSNFTDNVNNNPPIQRSVMHRLQL
jgi:hypothetical protein